MPESSATEYLNIYKSLFKGRDDVFAIRWEKDGKSGYTPGYDVDWSAYNIHKAKGGTFQSFQQKTPKPLTDEQILKHLHGEHFIGIYPLLQDNTSWFIAADFDEENWVAQSTKFIEICIQHSLPAYLERSRSGKGAHVWIFFAKPYPANKSRKIVTALLEQIGILATGGVNSSFDRLFPNQDYLSGKGMGNLIALPLNKKCYEQGNNCFVDPRSLKPIEPQWDLLRDILKIEEEQLNQTFEKICGANNTPHVNSLQGDKLTISIGNKIHISRAHLPLALLNLVKEHLNFRNSEYIIKKKSGQPTWGTQPYFKVLEERPDEVIVPRGLAGKILRFCREQNILFNFRDTRKRVTAVPFTSTIQLKDFQAVAMDSIRKKDLGIIVAPPGAGKTVIGLALIAEKQQPALIIVHRQQLAEQWQERIQSFLGIPKHEIGLIAQGEVKIGNKITLAMIQSLSKLSLNNELKRLKDTFGLVLIDECHHIPAETYRDCIEQFSNYYLYGLTATPFRRHNDEKLLFAYLGDVIAEIPVQTASQDRVPHIIIHKTSLDVPFNSKTDKTETLFKALVHDSSRNKLILSDIEKELIAGRKALIITERKEHIAALEQYLKHSYDIITLSGDDNEPERTKKWQLLKENDFDVLITTGQLFGEGIDLTNLECLFLVYPFSFEGKLVQYIGRVQRGEFSPIIYDYRDSKIDYFEKLFLKRNVYYNKLRKRGSLKEKQELILLFHKDKVEIAGSHEILELASLDLPVSIERFRENISWLIRVLKYEGVTGSLFCEILDYDYTQNKASQYTLQFIGVQQIRFRSIDTTHLLKCVILKPHVFEKSTTSCLKYERETQAGPVEIIEETIKVPVATLEFGYGTISFTYFSQQLYQQLKFEVPNQEMRPEFEVLKSYFSKMLKSKKVRVAIRLEIVNGILTSIQATSSDLERLNQEIIDGLKFQFVIKDVLGRKNQNGSGSILGLNECLKSEENKPALYQSEQDFLYDLLKWKNVKHFYQLKYLALRHDVKVSKIRFILIPFSFVFLLTGEKQYHVILETLDTEEATYIWHIDKSSGIFTKELQMIEKSIGELRSTGRQAYLSSSPRNFSRILHDYSDAKKGFILWKGLLEEGLV